MATIAEVAAEVRDSGLSVYGVAQDDREPSDGDTIFRSVVLLGPGDGFWEIFSASEESRDGDPDPMDRWSRRVVSRLADATGSVPLFPFGGPPYQPFLDWALKSGRCWVSPVGLLVHDQAGLMVSFRGALGFDLAVDDHAQRADGTTMSKRPCDTCVGQPCVSACPVDALSEEGYDVDGCKAFLRTEPGQDCMSQGCAVRRACPISAGADRMPEQSAFHMRAFL